MTTLLEPPSILAAGRPPRPGNPLQAPAEEQAEPNTDVEEELEEEGEETL